MNQIRRGIRGSKRIEMGRCAAHVARIVLLLALLLNAAAVLAAPSLRIAVAPFVGEQEVGERKSASVADALTGRLALRDLDRLIAPGEFVASTDFEPRAADVRRWAHNSAVDTIVVGRIVPLQKGAQAGGRIVETAVRSGHSGVELSRYDVVVARDADLDRSVERLAVEILGGLGYVEPASDDRAVGASAPAVSAKAASTTDADRAAASRADSSRGGLQTELTRSGFRNDAPIEIKADEAEIINRDEGRKLIFQRNVFVRQANVTLRSDRLEASYRKGESEPRELIAEGSVHIVQENRHANCDRAVYLREANRLTCSGHAELVQGCDVVRGESIEFDLASDRARVEGAASIVIQPEDAVPSECEIDRGQM